MILFSDIPPVLKREAKSQSPEILFLPEFVSMLTANSPEASERFYPGDGSWCEGVKVAELPVGPDEILRVKQTQANKTEDFITRQRRQLLAWIPIDLQRKERFQTKIKSFLNKLL
jgi:hypothetical protein